jgi:hypothetical protein
VAFSSPDDWVQTILTLIIVPITPLPKARQIKEHKIKEETILNNRHSIRNNLTAVSLITTHKIYINNLWFLQPFVFIANGNTS